MNLADLFMAPQVEPTVDLAAINPNIASGYQRLLKPPNRFNRKAWQEDFDRNLKGLPSVRPRLPFELIPQPDRLPSETPNQPSNRAPRRIDRLADYFESDEVSPTMVAALFGNHPMGGRTPYEFERPRQLPSWLTDNPVEPGWLPPGAQYNQPPPPMQPSDWYDPQAHPAPKFHVPPGKELKPRGLVT